MKIFADLHIHGPYSRATSKNTTIETLEKHARIKGINLLGTGDFTHPKWLSQLKNSLEEDGSGILKTDTGFRFMLTTEVSNIYSQGGRLRKVHNVIHAPDFETADQINEFLGRHGKLDSDGRPVFGGMSCAELVEGLVSITPRIAVVPAHIWTPWFGILGSKSGFDSIEECFQDQTRHIFALETGLSSDPPMNWRLSSLDKYALVSNSDAHSYWPWRIGREANVFELDRITYDAIMETIKKKDSKHFLYTIEVDPSYGKYHLDGHRECGVRLTPAESRRHSSICPVCRKPLTVGVLNRVEELADRPDGFRPEDAVPFKSLLPLTEILSTVTGIKQLQSKKIWSVYNRLVSHFGSELNVLLDAPENEIEDISGKETAKTVLSIRNGMIDVEPGYDGVYGRLSEGTVKMKKTPQKRIENFIY